MGRTPPLEDDSAPEENEVCVRCTLNGETNGSPNPCSLIGVRELDDHIELGALPESAC